MNIKAMRDELNRLLSLDDGAKLTNGPGLGSVCVCMGGTRDAAEGPDIVISAAYIWCSVKTREFHRLHPDPSWYGCYVSTPGIMTPRRRKFVEWLLVELEKETVDE